MEQKSSSVLKRAELFFTFHPYFRLYSTETALCCAFVALRLSFFLPALFLTSAEHGTEPVTERSETT